MLKLMLISFLLTSCASSSAREWGPWQETSINLSKMRWDFCQKRLHGIERNGDICYVTKECRTRNTIFNNVRKECRPKLLTCKTNDFSCMDGYGIFNKTIMNE